ncbi:hypothetical protein F4777DRAFT_426885 [Nemania sp. FL0916]|nr:hypothetical protein F4777DRAFT_426885 [Nemania sp. FL0916]
MAEDPDRNSNIRFCNLCYKPITSESGFKRHVAYCRRTVGKTKKRKRSCKQCHRAKAKCSFEPQCSRCVSKGFNCEYEKLPPPPVNNDSLDNNQDASTSEPSGSSPSDGTTSPNNGSTDSPSLAEVAAMLGPQVSSPPRAVLELRADPRTKASAMFILDTLRTIPSMMIRRETFPPFLHGHWHQPMLPKTFANCVRISQLYLTRNTSPRDKELFNITIEDEKIRVADQLSTTPKEELITRLTSQIIYVLLTVFDNDSSQPDTAPKLTAQAPDVQRLGTTARECFSSDSYLPFNIDNMDDPNETWEEFIYAESRRRAAIFWFVVSRVIDILWAVQCPPVLCYRGLALPCPDAVWRARTQQDWEVARAEAARDRYSAWDQPSSLDIGVGVYENRMRTLGDLIDSRAYTPDSDRGRQVSSWLANADKLGLILLTATTMV